MLSSDRSIIRRKYLWKGGCLSLSMLYLVSFVVMGYLKFLGEVMPFCFYDNFYYGTAYFGLFLYSIMLMELSDVPINKSQARLLYSNKFLCCCVMFAEYEALFQFVLNYRPVSYDLEVDLAASRFIYALLTIGIVRLVLITVLAVFAARKLNHTIEVKTYHPDLFGSMVTFFSDFTIIQLYCYTSYIYDFTLPLMLIISAVCYAYYKYIRV